MSTPSYDLAVIGGGIVGVATAMTLTATTRLSLVVLEAEEKLAVHQSGRNSGVIHSGLYYKPGSLKAINCVEGREALYRFCRDHGVPYERCGKLVVAIHPDELPALAELERRGQANGLVGLRRLTPEQIQEHEPHTTGIAGLHVPQTGIVDYALVTQKYAELTTGMGGTVRTGFRVERIARYPGEFVLEAAGAAVSCRYLINCGGLHSDRIARLSGVDPRVVVVPFRGEYYELVPERRGLVRNLIYPVPDPRFPFLGVHFTRMVRGGIEAGPNAVLAFKREGYRLGNVSVADMRELLGCPGFWRMAGRYWRTGLGEFHRSLSKGAFVRALRKLIPELTPADLTPARAGVRAQALAADGNLVDDFRIETAERMIHVLNAPSPAATASLSVGKTIASLAVEHFGLTPDRLRACQG